MSGQARMDARTNGHMATAQTVAELLGGADTGSSAGTTGGSAARSPDVRPQLYSKDILG